MKKTKRLFVITIVGVLLISSGMILYTMQRESDSLEHMEVVHISTDRIFYDNLQEVETDATIIVEAIAKDTVGQKVSLYYDYEFQKELPGSGYTEREMEISKVYKGDVAVGDKIILLQSYYTWTYEDGSKQLISSTYLKPAVKNEKYLLFLKYNESKGGYWPVCDYQGMYALSSDVAESKAKSGMTVQSDLSYLYNYETLFNLQPVYNEVANKYFQ